MVHSSALLHWGSQKQSFRAESPAASETAAGYCALKYSYSTPHALQECASVGGPVPLWLDNKQVLSLAKNGGSEALFFMHKAANARDGLLKDAVELGLIEPLKIASKLNPTNIFTKPLDRIDHERECSLLGLRIIIVDTDAMWREVNAVSTQ
jgi:hypothetical protein